MSIFCRLCAELKEPRQLKTIINDELLQIKAKLIDCCRWYLLEETEDDCLPQNVCTSCVERLEESWAFAQAVARAQTKLKSVFLMESSDLTEQDHKIKIDFDELNESHDYEDLFVESVPSLKAINVSEFSEPIVLLDKSNCDELLAKYQSKKTKEKSTDGKPSLPVRKNECDVCGKVFRIDKFLKVHMRVHTGERPYPCPECDMKFAKSITRRKHMRSQHEDIGEVRCVKCGETFSTKHHWRMHIASHPDNRQFVCYLCGKISKVLPALKRHMRVHTGERPYPCFECDLKFKLSSTRRRHMVTQHGIGTNNKPVENIPSICHICNQQFDNKFNLRLHKRTHEDLLKKCKECGKVFSTAKDVRRHMTTHSENRPFGCYLCSKTFKLKSVLKTHMRAHTGESKRICEICGANFMHNRDLLLHMTVHSDDRPYKCDFCDKAFKQLRNMKKHRKTHTDPKEHKCSQCNKEFRKKLSLKRHMEYHSGSIVKPFACEYCDKAFRERTNLVEHIRIHTGEKPHHCESCDTFFRTMSSYYGHLRKTHGISMSARKHEAMKATITETA